MTEKICKYPTDIVSTEYSLNPNGLNGGGNCSNVNATYQKIDETYIGDFSSGNSQFKIKEIACGWNGKSESIICKYNTHQIQVDNSKCKQVSKLNDGTPTIPLDKFTNYNKTYYISDNKKLVRVYSRMLIQCFRRNGGGYELIGISEENGKGLSCGLLNANSNSSHPLINNKKKYTRLFIKSKEE